MATSATPTYNFPYPLGTESLSNLNENIQALAERIEETYTILDINLSGAAQLVQAGDALVAGDIQGNWPTFTIRNDAVTTDKILNRNVTGNKIDEYTITNINVDDDAIETRNILDQNVTTAKIDDLGVTTAKIDDLAVTTGKINDAAVTTAKLDVVDLPDGSTANTYAVSDTTNKVATNAFVNNVAANFVLGALSANSVVEFMMDDDSVDTRAIVDGAVTSAKIADDTIVNDDVNASAGIVYSKLDLTDSIVNADVNSAAAIADTKLDTISTAGKVANSATTATADDDPSTIMLRNADRATTIGGLDFDVTNIPTDQAARVVWSVEDGGPKFGATGGLQVPIGQKNIIFVKNDSGVQILKGQSVMAVGVTGDRIRVAKAVADGSVNARYMLGIAAENIDDGTEGFLVTNGYVRNVNTSAYGLGTVLFFDPNTAGGLTTVEPSAPNLNLPVAIVSKVNAASGILYVRMKTGEYLNEVHDVQITSASDGDSLEYDSGTGVWKNVPYGNVPVGTITAYAGATAPDGWLLANGDVVPNGSGTVQSKTYDFAALYAIVGSQYGTAGTIPTFSSTTGIYIIKAV
jgi:hypothetical protein